MRLARVRCLPLAQEQGARNSQESQDCGRSRDTPEKAVPASPPASSVRGNPKRVESRRLLRLLALELKEELLDSVIL